MEWTKDLVAKLPTLKGTSYFIYVASHWGRISAEIDEYRRRVQDQKEWHEENEKHLTKLHHRKMEIMVGDLQREMEQKAVVEEKAQLYETLWGHTLDLYVKAVVHLAKIAALYPAEWHIGRFSLDPTVRELVEKAAEKMKADLPPVPPPPIVPPIFTGLGLLGVKPLSGDPKDPNKEKGNLDKPE